MSWYILNDILMYFRKKILLYILMLIIRKIRGTNIILSCMHLDIAIAP